MEKCGRGLSHCEEILPHFSVIVCNVTLLTCVTWRWVHLPRLIVMAHMWANPTTGGLIHICDMINLLSRRDSFVFVTWLVPICDLTHLPAWHGSFTFLTRLMHICDTTHWRVWQDSFTFVTWLMHICDMTHAHLWHDSLTRVTRLIHICDMTHSHMWHDSFTRMTWIIHMCGMTHSHVQFDSFTFVTRLIDACDMLHLHLWRDTFVMWHICDVTHLWRVIWHQKWCQMSHHDVRCHMSHVMWPLLREWRLLWHLQTVIFVIFDINCVWHQLCHVTSDVTWRVNVINCVMWHLHVWMWYFYHIHTCNLTHSLIFDINCVTWRDIWHQLWPWYLWYLTSIVFDINYVMWHLLHPWHLTHSWHWSHSWHLLSATLTTFATTSATTDIMWHVLREWHLQWHLLSAVSDICSDIYCLTSAVTSMSLMTCITWVTSFVTSTVCYINDICWCCKCH